MAQLLQRRAMNYLAWLRFPTKGKILLFSTSSIPAVTPTKLSIQWVPRAKLTDHLQPVLRSIIVEPYLHFPVCLHATVLDQVIKHRNNRGTCSQSPDFIMSLMFIYSNAVLTRLHLSTYNSLQYLSSGELKRCIG